MIYKARSENDFYIVELAIDGVIVFSSDLFNEADGNTTKLKATVERSVKIKLDILNEPEKHGPRIKVYPADNKNLLMFTIPIDRNSGDINTKIEKEKNFKENNTLHLNKKELRDFIQDVSRSSISLIMDFYNGNGDEKKKDTIQNRIDSLQKCKTKDDRKALVEKFRNEDI